MLELLEPRRLMSVSLSKTGTLAIIGSSKADVVSLQHTGDQMIVTVNGVAQQFPYANIRRVRADLVGGDDVFIAHGNIYRPMIINGGSGNDDLRGGIGSDSITGAGGNDSIIGGYGNDTLDGGSGYDRIDAADDPLIDPYFSGPGYSSDVINAVGGPLDFDVIHYGYFDQLHADATDQLDYRFGITVQLAAPT